MSFINNKRPYEEDVVCNTCGKNMNDLCEGIEECNKCEDQMMNEFAATSVLGHIWDVIPATFHFQFMSALTSVIWAISKVFKVGDYHPENGIFGGNKYHRDRDIFN